MIVLLSVNLLGLSQNSIKVDSTLFTGVIEVDSVKLPIEFIRKANIKLIEAKSEKEIKNQLLATIENYKTENNYLNNFIDRQNKILIDAAKYNAKIQEENNKLEKQRNISFSINGGLIFALILIILL